MSAAEIAVYDILVKEAGARDDESNRAQFHNFWKNRDSLVEFRFIGTLGFGGKFWVTRGRMYVNCYAEDLTGKREETIRRTNEALDRFSKAVVR